MRNTKTNTICTLALGAILTIGFNAAAQVDPNMEAGVSCSNAECMFRGNPQTHDATALLQRLPYSGGARLMNVNRFENNPDQVVNRSVETQFAPIGELETVRSTTDENGNVGTDRGSGFIVSPCYILTNAHVVYGVDLRPVQGKDYSMKFRAGVSQASAFAGNTIATPVISGNRESSGKGDWVLMKLNSCIGKRADFGWLEAAQADAQSIVGKTMAVAGYAGDRERGQLSLGTGKVQGVDSRNGMFTFSGSMAPGESGGAVLTVENGVMKVAGLNTAQLIDRSNPNTVSFDSYNSTRANEFQNVAEILGRADVRMVLDADKAEFGQSNPAAQRSTRPLPRTQTASI